VKVFFLAYTGTMQTRLMQLMADKLTTSLAVEGELSDKGLAALSESSEGLARELAKMLLEKSGNDQNLKDLWAAYRKKELHVEAIISTEMTDPLLEKKTLLSTEQQIPTPGISKASSEIEQIGNTLVKVDFIEYIGKRKRKVTHIEVRHSELDQMIEQANGRVGIQFSLF
jgi:hypothetical protein